MQQSQVVGWALVVLVGCSAVLPVLALPHQVPPPQQLQHRQYPVYQHPSQQQHQQPHAEARKYAEKPNAMKKVPIDNDLDDIQTNQISVSFWSATRDHVLYRDQEGSEVHLFDSYFVSLLAAGRLLLGQHAEHDHADVVQRRRSGRPQQVGGSG